MTKVALVVNTSWNVWNFRMSLLRRLEAEGYDISVIAPEDEFSSRLPFAYHPVSITSRSLNPFVDLRTFIQLYCVLRKIRPDVVLLYTAKPNVYGNFAARFLGIRAISNIAGLGAVFVRGGLLVAFMKLLYRLSLARAAKVFFQNRDDLQGFLAQGIVRESVVDLLPGSGVDLERFNPAKKKTGAVKASFVFLLSARMLWDKGIADYVRAGERLVAEGYPATFRLLGFLDVDNPKAITRAEMAVLTDSPGICYRGVSSAVETELAEADCVVLPSFYREGSPRSLLEAAAMGIPLITTDTPGCRDVVEDGITGYLCRPGDVEDLYRKMKMMLDLPPAERILMGLRGREKMVREYDENIVIEKYLAAVRALLPGQ